MANPQKRSVSGTGQKIPCALAGRQIFRTTLQTLSLSPCGTRSADLEDEIRSILDEPVAKGTNEDERNYDRELERSPGLVRGATSSIPYMQQVISGSSAGQRH
jgi:hypothetical protein